VDAPLAVKALQDANLASPLALWVYLGLAVIGVVLAGLRAPLVAWPAAFGALTITFSWFIAPAMNGERSGNDFVRTVLSRVEPDEKLALVAYKEQFLLYLDRPTWNFGHRRWLEGPQESYDAAAWLNAEPGRVLLVPEAALVPKDRFHPERAPVPCFVQNTTRVGRSSDDDWYLVRAPAEADCASRGDVRRAIHYPSRVH
jgi:hypothetical protein